MNLFYVHSQAYTRKAALARGKMPAVPDRDGRLTPAALRLPLARAPSGAWRSSSWVRCQGPPYCPPFSCVGGVQLSPKAEGIQVPPRLAGSRDGPSRGSFRATASGLLTWRSGMRLWCCHSCHRRFRCVSNGAPFFIGWRGLVIRSAHCSPMHPGRKTFWSAHGILSGQVSQLTGSLAGGEHHSLQ